MRRRRVMANIIFDSRKIMVYEDLKFLAEAVGKDQVYIQKLWDGMLACEGLYDEFLYFIDHKSLKDEFRFRGYSLTDIYVYMISRTKMANDYGKDIVVGGREILLLDTFMGMVELMENPEEYIKRLDEGLGMDKF